MLQGHVKVQEAQKFYKTKQKKTKAVAIWKYKGLNHCWRHECEANSISNTMLLTFLNIRYGLSSELFLNLPSVVLGHLALQCLGTNAEQRLSPIFWKQIKEHTERRF